jgi:hypothetical protein
MTGREIREHLDQDPVTYRKLSERLREVLEKLGEQWDELAQALQGVEDLALQALEVFQGHVEEVAGAAGGVEHADGAELGVEFRDLGLPVRGAPTEPVPLPLPFSFLQLEAKGRPPRGNPR